MIAMVTMNDCGEFVMHEQTKRIHIRTDAEKREAYMRRLVDAGLINVCDICGKPFAAKGWKRHAKRCSWECSQEANRRQARERKRRRKKVSA